VLAKPNNEGPEMMKKSLLLLLFLFFAIFIAVGTVLSPGGLSSQAQTQDLRIRHPEIEGIYELQVPGEESSLRHVYFRNGKLRTAGGGIGASVAFDPVDGNETEFSTTLPKGTFRLTLLKDEQGRYTRYRVVNESARLEFFGVRKSNFDDSRLDPASSSDCLSYFERHYEKTEHMVPMRDGVRLFTQIYSPLDRSEPHPILLMRTPYGVAPYGDTFRFATGPSLFFAKENYILVFQDIRGRSMSEGTFQFMRPYVPKKGSSSDVDESSDAFDTVEWLLKNLRDHNGKVGIWGISYPGFTAAMAAIAAHPAVKAVSPQAPMGDLFLGDDGHHSGALYLNHYATFLYETMQPRETPAAFKPAEFPYKTPDGYAFFLKMGPLENLSKAVFQGKNPVWNEMMTHETYDDYWKTRSVYAHLGAIKPGILTVGGWYDAEDLLGTLKTYQTIEAKNPDLPSRLVMGPWVHGGWSMTNPLGEDRGVFSFRGTRIYFQENVVLPFFNYYLKDKGILSLPEAFVFETGSDQWRSFGQWPPIDAKERKLFFADGGQLSWDGAPPFLDDGFDEYTSDPSKPVPYTLRTAARYNRDYFVEDQRFAASRPDVLVYSGEPLAEDLTIAGPIKAELYVSTTGTDADWVVKVIDVYPRDAPDPEDNPLNVRMGNYQRLIRGDIIRGKFRDSFENPKPFVPGKVTKVTFELPDIAHTFLKGHRIMVQVQSSWFPLFDRNPQKFCNIREAGEEDFQKATHRVYHTSRYPSGITLRVLPK
jgi:putative CocE/NonD family hydrolase